MGFIDQYPDKEGTNLLSLELSSMTFYLDPDSDTYCPY